MGDLETPSETHHEIALPKPQEQPEADVVIYDGNCVFCSAQVENLFRLDGRNRLAFVSLHDPFVKANFADLSHDEMMKQIYLVPSNRAKADSNNGYSEKRLGGASALRYLTRRLPKLWIFAPLLHIPFTLPIWQWGYQLIAKRRYKIAGRTGDSCESDACEIHFGQNSDSEK